MIRSMTGYGKAICHFKNKVITLEIKSVNSKQLDVSLRIPNIYKEKEYEIRNEINRQAERGKIDLNISVEQDECEKSIQINQKLVKEYFSQIKNIAEELSLPVNESLLIRALKMPDTLKSEANVLDEKEWNEIMKGIREALKLFGDFRIQEGKALENDILQRVASIETHLNSLEKFEAGRVVRVRERISKNMNEFIPTASVDANRFEQEIIYFLEKLDITEEKVRLRNHCDYFRNTAKEESAGRKLGFITQEIGREINTIGSKANDSDIQKHVVQMKDELEKIKEQLLNIL